MLADTQATVRSDNFALKKMGLKTISIEQYRQVFDIPIIKYWNNLGYNNSFLKNNFETLEKYYYQKYEQLESKCRARKGVKELLVWLNKNNIKSIIYSNHATPHISKQLVRLKMNKLVWHIIGRGLNDDSHHFKRGKEQKLFEYVRSKKLQPKQIISVGDTEEEIEIAGKLGYYSVALTGGWNSVARLKKHKPDFLIHNMRELVGIIKKLNK